MFKIENILLINQNIDKMSFISVIKEFLKEANMLISNIHFTHIHLKREVGDSFPLENDKYDGSWYKNLLIAAEIIIDRLHSRIDENKDYLKMFNDIHDCDFMEFARKWNKINFMVKYNLADQEWEEICKKYNIYATSRKLEEIISKKVLINLPLLQSLNLNLDEYRSVAKVLEDEGRNDYDSLISVLVPKALEENANVAGSLQQPNNQPLPQPQQGPVPAPAMEPKREKGPLSPLKREMDQILKWIKFREEEFKAYKQKMNKGYDPEEYKSIVDQLEKVRAELESVDKSIAETKKVIPVDPIAREMAQIERWTKEQEKAFKQYLKAKNTDYKYKEELNQIEKCLARVQAELYNVDEEIKATKPRIPVDPLAKELNQVLSWIKSRQVDVRAYKRQQSGESVNDELKLIEKELEIIHNRSRDISETINFIHSSRPVDPYKKELDQLLRWISTKEKTIRKLKAETAKKERMIKAELLNRVRNEINYIDEEIDNSRNLIHEPTSDLVQELKMIDEVENNDDVLENDIVENEVEAPKVELIVPSDEELYDIASIYDVEASVLKTAIEVMGEELAKEGYDALPQMLKNLIQSGYIQIKQEYDFDPNDEYKLREVVKINN